MPKLTKRPIRQVRTDERADPNQKSCFVSNQIVPVIIFHITFEITSFALEHRC